jgi:uncharacterized membrane protein
MSQQTQGLSARSGADRNGVHRFTTVEWAVIGSLAANVVVQMSVFLPALASVVPTDAKVVGVIQALVAVAGAWGLWNRRQWGRRTTLVVTLFNVVGSATALFDPASAAVVVAVAVTISIGVPVMVLLWSRPLKEQLVRARGAR